MINISRSPLRISFFGGGTDYPTYFMTSRRGARAPDRQVHLYDRPADGGLRREPVSRHLPHRRRRRPRRGHQAQCHPRDAARNGLRSAAQSRHISDLPGNSGLGEPSSFTVGFVALMEHLQRTRDHEIRSLQAGGPYGAGPTEGKRRHPGSDPRGLRRPQSLPVPKGRSSRSAPRRWRPSAATRSTARFACSTPASNVTPRSRCRSS